VTITVTSTNLSLSPSLSLSLIYHHQLDPLTCIPKPSPNHVRQPCTSTINHVHQIVPYHASTMYHTKYINHVHQCTSYMYQEYSLHHAPNMCLKHIPMPQQGTKGMIITSSTNNQDIPQAMFLKHFPTSINHVPRDTIKHVPYHSYSIQKTIFQVSKMCL
jgi:hypothetical protein